MTFSHQFKPAHKEIKAYYEELALYATHEVAHEGAHQLCLPKPPRRYLQKSTLARMALG